MKKEIILNNEETIEEIVVENLKDVVEDSHSYYHVRVEENKITVAKQGYNTLDIESVSFDMSGLNSDEQKVQAIVMAYIYTFSKTGDLKRRFATFYDNMKNLETNSFYHDYTKNYPEDQILRYIERKYTDVFKEQRKR